jgi:hypothetical protein
VCQRFFLFVIFRGLENIFRFVPYHQSDCILPRRCMRDRSLAHIYNISRLRFRSALTRLISDSSIPCPSSFVFVFLIPTFPYPTVVLLLLSLCDRRAILPFSPLSHLSLSFRPFPAHPASRGPQALTGPIIELWASLLSSPSHCGQ